MAREDWTDAENAAIVDDYFAMLASELAGEPYSKAQHNRRLQASLGRSHASVEFKHCNISAALQGLGETWISGYRPAFHLQGSLVEAVARALAANPARFSASSKFESPVRSAAFADVPALWIGPPPTHSNAPPPAELFEMSTIAQTYDVAERDARNRALGRAGEIRALVHERASLIGVGRSDLAERVRWVADLDGDGAGFDIASFAPDGADRLIEVKTTNGWERTPFHISRHELTVAAARREDWLLLRLWNFAREPRAFELRPPLDAHVALTPTSFQASFQGLGC